MQTTQQTNVTNNMFLFYRNGKIDHFFRQLPEEKPLTIVVNGQYLVTLMCTPINLKYLVTGFLYLEGIINSITDLAIVTVCDQEEKSEVKTTIPYNCNDFRDQKVISSGCTGGVTTKRKILNPLPENIKTTVSFQQILALMECMLTSAKNYLSTGGIHTSGLSLDGDHLTVIAEDIGRHNSIDKLVGECLIRGISFGGGIILTTGRISSEMVAKAARIEVPILISKTSPTTLSLELAQELGITLIGYVRANSMKIYTHSWRVIKGKTNE